MPRIDAFILPTASAWSRNTSSVPQAMPLTPCVMAKAFFGISRLSPARAITLAMLAATPVTRVVMFTPAAARVRSMLYMPRPAMTSPPGELISTSRSPSTASRAARKSLAWVPQKPISSSSASTAGLPAAFAVKVKQGRIAQSFSEWTHCVWRLRNLCCGLISDSETHCAATHFSCSRRRSFQTPPQRLFPGVEQS